MSEDILFCCKLFYSYFLPIFTLPDSALAAHQMYTGGLARHMHHY